MSEEGKQKRYFERHPERRTRRWVRLPDTAHNRPHSSVPREERRRAARRKKARRRANR
jgi:hypothetical protein